MENITQKDIGDVVEALGRSFDDELHIRHGELMLVPVNPSDAPDFAHAVEVKDYVASHSETGHHHVIEGTSMVLDRLGHDPFVALTKPSRLVHHKTHDKHDTVPLPKGIFRVLRKREYDPFTKAMQKVWD